MSSKQVRLAGSILDRSRHVCAFFNTKKEEYQVLLPFIKEGFEQGDRAFHVVDPRHRSEHLRRLEQAGIPVVEAERSGQLEIRRWEDFLRTHPMVIVGGILQNNPFFVPPDEFLKELRARNSQ